jgi:hemolysin activation/secretion protein
MIAACCAVASASAQEAKPTFPPSAEPDLSLEQVVPPREPAPEGELRVPESGVTGAPEGAEAVRFALTGLDIDGVTAYRSDLIEPLVGDLVGKEISLADIYAAAAAIERHYREDGYFLTRVMVPPQVIEGGRVRILVLEGYVSEVTYQGDVGPVQERIASYVDQVLAERPLKLATLERQLLLAKDIPGVTVNGILRPSPEQAGSAQLVVAVERKRFDGLVMIDNIGSTFTGEWEVAGSVAANAFTRYGESIALTALLSDPANGIGNSAQNQYVVQLGGSFRPDARGTYVNLLGSYGDSNPGGLISEFEFESKKLLLTAVGGFPIIRSRDRNLAVEVGFDYIESDTDVFDDIKFSRDRLRVLHLDGRTDFRDGWGGSNSFGLSLRQGLPILNASESGDDYLSRPDGDGVFTTVRAAASRYQPIRGRFGFFGELAGQYAFNNLLSDEEFDVGGVRFGRGYDPKELAGDHGVGFTGELQFTETSGNRFVERYQLFGFYDLGSVWDRGTDLSASLASSGAGVRAWFARNVSLALEVAKPLTRDSQRADDTKDPQLLLRAFARF